MIATTKTKRGRGRPSRAVFESNRDAVLAAWRRLATSDEPPSIADVARLAGVSRDAASGHLVQAGLHEAQDRPIPAPADATIRERVAAAVEQLIADRRALSIRAVARLAGVCKETARAHMANPEAVARSAANTRAAILAAHRKLIAAGRLPSIPEMARESGACESSIRRHLTAAGLGWRRLDHAEHRPARKASPADIARAIADAMAARRAKDKPRAEPEPSVTEAAVRDYRRAVKNVRRCAWSIHGGWLSPMRDQINAPRKNHEKKSAPIKVARKIGEQVSRRT